MSITYFFYLKDAKAKSIKNRILIWKIVKNVLVHYLGNMSLRHNKSIKLFDQNMKILFKSILGFSRNLKK